MEKLRSYSNDWRKAQIETSEFITPDDGKYRVLIDEVTYSERDRDGNETYPTFIYILTITEGNQKGQRFRRYSSIRNEKSAGFIKGDLQKLGIPIPADIEELPELFSSAAGSVIDVTVKTREVNGKPYKDVYIERLIGRQQKQQRPQQQVPPAYQPQPQGYRQPAPQYTPNAYNQPQAFGAGYNQNEEIPF